MKLIKFHWIFEKRIRESLEFLGRCPELVKGAGCKPVTLETLEVRVLPGPLVYIAQIG